MREIKETFSTWPRSHRFPRMKLLALWLLLASPLLSPAFSSDAPKPLPNPFLSGALTAVLPGAGHLYNGDHLGAAAAFANGLGMFALMAIPSSSVTSARVQEQLGIVVRNAYGFSVYDSFQQALDLNGRPKLLVEHPRYSALELITSPFYKHPYTSGKVWVPVGISLGLAALALASRPITASPGTIAIGVPLVAIGMLFIGAGEEAEFRGYYHPAFAELTGSRPLGNVMQAAFFGLCHTSLPACAFPQGTGLLARGILTGSFKQPVFNSGTDLGIWAATSLMGLYLGWIAQSSELGLQKAITVHAAWNTFLLIPALLQGRYVPIQLSFRF